MKKRIGYALLEGMKKKPIWGTVYSWETDIYMSIYFNIPDNPVNCNWYMDLKARYNFKTIEKGGYRYGFYYKIICSRKIDDMRHLLKELKKWEYSDNKFNIKLDVDEVLSCAVLNKL